jgi:hypothetical protein
MSKGLGAVQRAILKLIADNPGGAWSFAALCRALYPPREIEATDFVSASAWAQACARRDSTTARRHAIGRALARLKLPGTWTTIGRGRNREAKRLYDPCNLESARKVAVQMTPWTTPAELAARVEKAKRWRDASAQERDIMRLDDEIAAARHMLSVIKDRSARDKRLAEIAALEQDKRALADKR